MQGEPVSGKSVSYPVPQLTQSLGSGLRCLHMLLEITRLKGPADIPGENPPLQVPRPELLMWDPSPGDG